MNGKRRNNQLAHSGGVVRIRQIVLAFWDESRSEAPRVSREGTESFAEKRGTESPAIGERWMEEVCSRALARVKANKGSAGVDGMTVHELPDYLKQHWPAIREQFLSGTYKPQPGKRLRALNCFHVRHLKIVETGYAQKPAPEPPNGPKRRGRGKQSKARNLLDRFQDHP